MLRGSLPTQLVVIFTMAPQMAQRHSLRPNMAGPHPELDPCPVTHTYAEGSALARGGDSDAATLQRRLLIPFAGSQDRG